jgi:hypothetical protein
MPISQIVTNSIANGAVTQVDLATGVAGTGPAFRAYLASDQTVTSVVNTKVTLNTEVFDTASCFDSTTNYRFTPNVAGYYQFNITLGASATTSMVFNYIQLRKNGASDSIAMYGPYSGTTNFGSLSAIIYMNGTTDYIELYSQLSGTGTLVVRGGSDAISTYMSGCLVRAA